MSDISKPSKAYKWTPEMTHRLKIMWSDHNIGQISRVLGVSGETVSRNAHKIGLPKKSRWDAQRLAIDDVCRVHRAFTPRCAEILGWEWKR